MANQEPSKIRFRLGTRANAISKNSQTGEYNEVALVPGQLLFAIYEDEDMSSANNTVVQGDIYLDLDDSDNRLGLGGIRRINLANDVDKARSLQSVSADTTGAGGNWTAHADGINQLYDGLTIAIKLEGTYSPTYNTLNINGLGDKLIWYTYNIRLTNQVPAGSEVLLTYRTNNGSYTTSSSSDGPGTLSPSSTYRDGWILNSVTRKMQNLTLLTHGDPTSTYTYNGYQNVTATLGTTVTFKTWEITS